MTRNKLILLAAATLLAVVIAWYFGDEYSGELKAMLRALVRAL